MATVGISNGLIKAGHILLRKDENDVLIFGVIHSKVPDVDTLDCIKNVRQVLVVVVAIRIRIVREVLREKTGIVVQKVVLGKIVLQGQNFIGLGFIDVPTNDGIAIMGAIVVLVGKDVRRPILRRVQVALVEGMDKEKQNVDVVKAVTFIMYHARRNEGVFPEIENYVDVVVCKVALDLDFIIFCLEDEADDIGTVLLKMDKGLQGDFHKGNPKNGVRII